jgi:hypothetical protein
MSRYLVLIYEDEQKWIEGAEGTEEAMADHYKFNIERADAIVAGHALQPTSTATTVRRDETGAVQVTDGPFVETKEALGGYYLIEADSFDAALEIARQVPAPFGGLEVRPVMVFEGGAR